jgi:hypothetical protein
MKSILAAPAAASLSERKDGCHGDPYPRKSPANGDCDADIRADTAKFWIPIELQKESKKTREPADAAAATADVRAAAEGMCCGHCSGNAEGHVAELPTAR